MNYKYDKLSFIDKQKKKQNHIPDKTFEFYKKMTEMFWIFIENNK